MPHDWIRLSKTTARRSLCRSRAHGSSGGSTGRLRMSTEATRRKRESLLLSSRLRLPVHDVSVVGNDDGQAEFGQAFDLAADALLEALTYRIKAFFQELLVDVFTVHG